MSKLFHPYTRLRFQVALIKKLKDLLLFNLLGDMVILCTGSFSVPGLRGSSIWNVADT